MENLKRLCQLKFLEDHSMAEWKEIINRNYLTDEDMQNNKEWLDIFGSNY